MLNPTQLLVYWWFNCVEVGDQQRQDWKCGRMGQFEPHCYTFHLEYGFPISLGLGCTCGLDEIMLLRPPSPNVSQWRSWTGNTSSALLFFFQRQKSWNDATGFLNIFKTFETHEKGCSLPWPWSQQLCAHFTTIFVSEQTVQVWGL